MKVDVVVKKGEVTEVVYKGVFDAEQQMYPSQSGAAPGHLREFRWDLGPDADHFGQGLRDDGMYVGTRPGCPAFEHITLSFVRGGGSLITQWLCVNN